MLLGSSQMQGFCDLVLGISSIRQKAFLLLLNPFFFGI